MPGTVASGVTTHLVVGGVSTFSFAALLPGVDGWVLAMSCSGGLVFVLNAQETSLLKRIVYFPISVLIGYVVAKEGVVGTENIAQSIVAFFGSALSITIIVQLMDFVTSGKFLQIVTDWVSRKRGN